MQEVGFGGKFIGVNAELQLQAREGKRE